MHLRHDFRQLPRGPGQDVHQHPQFAPVILSPQQLGDTANDAHRGAQLVVGDGDELLLELVERLQVRRHLLQAHRFALHAQLLQAVLHHQLRMDEVDRLGDEIVGTGLHDFHRHLHGPEAGHDDHRKLGLLGLERGQQRLPAHARHGQIGDDQIEAAPAGQGQRLLRVGHDLVGVGPSLQVAPPDVSYRRFVLDQQNLRIWLHAAFACGGRCPDARIRAT